MTRSSPLQLNKKPNQERLPLPDALKKGAIALHNFELNEGKGRRESPFKVKTGISYGLTTKGKKQKRIYIYVAYAKTEEGRKILAREIAVATKGKIPVHAGRMRGAFWVIVSMSKRAYQKVVENWEKAFKKTFALIVYLFLLIYVVLHPELKDLVMKIVETPLIPGL